MSNDHLCDLLAFCAIFFVGILRNLTGAGAGCATQWRLRQKIDCLAAELYVIFIHMPTHRLPLQPVLSAEEYAALDRFGAAHPGTANLAAIAGFLREHCNLELSTDPEIIAGFAVDSSHLPGTAQGLARPADERGCAAVLRICRAAGIPVTFSGGKSNLTGSATPPDGVVLSTVRMLEPAVRVNTAGRCAAAPVGILLEDMRREIMRQTAGKWRYPVDPTSRADATVGGCLACNASGFTPGEQGATRAWVQSLRFLLPNGMLIEAERNQYVSSGGSFSMEDGRAPQPWPVPTYPRPPIKNAGGPFSSPDGVLDFVDLAIGSEGIFGLATACTLRLAENPREYLDLCISLPDEDAALRLLAAARAHFEGNLGRLTALEYFGVNCRQFMKHAARFYHGTDQVGVYIQEPLFDQAMEDAAAVWLEILAEAGLDVPEPAILVLDTDALRNLFLEARHSLPANALEVVQQRGTFTIMTDTVVPFDKFREFLNFTHALIRKNELDYLSFGHMGDCHLHFTILPRKAQIDRAVAVYDAIIARSADLGGVYSGEHGTGKRKRQDFLRCYGPAALEMVRQSKQAVDPQMLINRGNVIPE